MIDRNERIHPAIPPAQKALEQGRISRRDFLRLATLLGLSLPAAQILAACAPAPTAAPAAATSAPATAAVKRGGTLKFGMPVPAVDHPARFSWVTDSNQFRSIFEYLTETGPDNITRPYLLEKWAANDALTEWTLTLRQGIKWSNGDELTSEDVLFNFKEWLKVETKSSILGLWQGILTIENVKAVDTYNIKLSLDAPKLDVPEALFHYPAQIMHRSFNGDVTTGKNPSTGPMKLDHYETGKSVQVSRRDGYWQNGADGKPLPYLDSLQFIDLGNDQTAYVAAMQSGQIDAIYDPTIETYQALKTNPKVKIGQVKSAGVEVLRMRVDLDPWKDVKVRQAFKMCQDRSKILQNAVFGLGTEGQDTHVAPAMADYAPIDTPKYDPAGAKKLLADAGHPNGLDVAISVGTGWTNDVAYAETLKEDAKAAGFNITLDTMPNSDYWNKWTETPVGITPWVHRPLGVMLLPLAYIADKDGKPVPWNESRWVDQEFSDLLKKAQGTLDLEKRRAIMKDLETIQQTRGSVAIAWFADVINIFNPKFQAWPTHPSKYALLREVWYDPDFK